MSSSYSRDPKFYNELKQLNNDFFKLIEATQKTSSYFDYTPTLNDYIRHFKDLDKQFPEKKPNDIGNATAPLFSANSTTTNTFPTTNNITFGSNTTATATTNQPTTTPVSPPKLTPFAPMKPFSTTSTISATSTSSTPFAPINSSASQPFVFGTPPTVSATTAANSITAPTNTSSFFSFNLAKKDDNNTASNAVSPFLTSVNNTATAGIGAAANANANAGGADEADEDAPPPEPNVEKYEEPNAKYRVRCKLYERGSVVGGSASMSLLGHGELFVKQMDAPNKLQIIVRQDPDLRRVMLNELVTANIPLKLLPKAVQMILPGAAGNSRFYIAKVKDENDAKQLYELLQTVKAT